jgi:hypothetical protein|tara:strand:- start:61 stop:195 length:135 start_codon:yes stop_codon:yes gene_type:complete
MWLIVQELASTTKKLFVFIQVAVAGVHPGIMINEFYKKIINMTL